MAQPQRQVIDYTAVPAVPETLLTIQPGQTSGTIRIRILDDEVNEPNEIFNVFLTPKFGVINGDPTRAVFSVTILDNEVPELSITAVETYIEEEANAMAEFEISTNIMPHSPIAIQYRPENTSFLADGITGEKQTSQPLTFTQENAGDPYTAKLRIPIVNDDLAEPNGTLKVTLLEEDPDLNNYDLHATNYHATVHIEDDDAEVPVLFVEGSTDGVAETAGTVEFTITAYDDQAKSNSINPERDISVQFTPEEVHSTGFFDNSGTTRTEVLTFTENNGIWSDTITLDINNQPTNIASGSIKVTLENDPEAVNSYTVALDEGKSASVSVWDENAPSITILAGNTITEGVDDKAIFKVISNVAPSADLSVQYTPIGVNHITGSGTKITANPAINFVKNNTTGKYEGLIEVDILDNDIYIPDGNVSVTLNNETTPTNYHVNSPATASVRIIENDPKPTLSIANLTPSVDEDDTSITIPVTLSNATSEAITYYWSTSALTASTSDFSGNSNDPITIASGTTGTVQMQLPIQITDDNYKENPETFTINLTRLRNALFPNSVDTYTITVTINDNEGATMISFSNTAQSVNESAGTVTIRANLNHIPNQTVSAEYSTSDGTATGTGENADFVAGTNQFFNFPAGKDFAEFTITINDDTINEPDEMFMIELREPINAAFANSATSIPTTITITDDDLPTLAFKTQSFNPPEEGGNFSVEVELLGTVREEVTFDITLGGGTASKTADYNDPTNDKLYHSIGYHRNDYNDSNFI